MNVFEHMLADKAIQIVPQNARGSRADILHHPLPIQERYSIGTVVEQRLKTLLAIHLLDPPIMLDLIAMPHVDQRQRSADQVDRDWCDQECVAWYCQRQ